MAKMIVSIKYFSVFKITAVYVFHSHSLVDLVGILNWRAYPNSMLSNLKKLMKIQGEEIVKVGGRKERLPGVS